MLQVGSLSIYCKKPHLFPCSESCRISLISSAVNQTQSICTMLRKSKMQDTYRNWAAWPFPGPNPSIHPSIPEQNQSYHEACRGFPSLVPGLCQCPEQEPDVTLESNREQTWTETFIYCADAPQQPHLSAFSTHWPDFKRWMRLTALHGKVMADAC